MTDRELLELAAKAACVAYDREASKPKEGHAWWGLWLSYDREPSEHDRRYWNPLRDDGDALRLANRLFLSIIHTSCLDDAPVVMVGEYMDHEKLEQHPAFPDGNAEVRRAIVLAAAEIGRAMP